MSEDNPRAPLSPQSQRAVFDTLFLPVFRRIRQWGASHEDAEEVATDTLRIVLRKLDEGIDLIGLQYAYAIGVGRRLFFRRVQRRKESMARELVAAGCTEPVAFDPPPEIELDEIIERHRDELLDGLTTRQHLILRLIEEGRASSGISAELEVSEGYIRVELFRARQRIAQNVREIRRRYYDGTVRTRIARFRT